MAVDQERPIDIVNGPFGGENTASQPTGLSRGQSRYLRNAYMTKLGAIAKRPGTMPLTSALGATIEHLTLYKASLSNAAPDILATSGTTLYKFNGTDTLTAQTMTNALNSADIYDVDFTDANSVSVKFITDGGSMKQYNGSAVKDIVPAADDASPAPPNDMTNINAKNPIYCWVYSSHIFVSDGKDIAWYSKRFYYDYFPSVQFERWVRENDYITGPGVAFDNVCLIPMRRGWGILTGSTVDDFNGNMFLNTVNGCIAPRTIQRITYPTGTQTVVYLSDDGIHEIYDTGFLDSGSRRYSTRSLMKDKVDFKAIGLTDSEKKAATAFFDERLSLYLLKFNQGSNRLVYAYDTRNGEWYPWNNIKANAILRNGDILYYAGEEKTLRKFDENLYSDWDDTGKTTGTPVYFDRYSDLVALEDTGYKSYLDYYMLWGKQYTVPSTLDLTVVFISTTVQVQNALNNQFMTWGTTAWGEAVWANLDYTDIAGNPKRIKFKKKSYYFQVRWENNRDQPVEVYKEKLTGRVSGEG